MWPPFPNGSACEPGPGRRAPAPPRPPLPASAVTAAFEKAAAGNRAALIGYLPAGFPSVDGAITAAVAMAEAGADIIEIGLPYSDPLMDGPVIQEATRAALTAGTKVADTLRTVEAVAATGVPVLVMTYWNPVDHYGVGAFARDLAAAGGSGLITPDLPPEEAGPWLEASDACGLDRVFLVAPSSTGAAGRGRVRGLPRFRLRGFADGHHRRPCRGERPGRRPGRHRPGPHAPPGRGRPRGAGWRPGRRGGGLRRRRDRRLGVRAATAGRARPRRRAWPRSVRWPPSWPAGSGARSRHRGADPDEHAGRVPAEPDPGCVAPWAAAGAGLRAVHRGRGCRRARG